MYFMIQVKSMVKRVLTTASACKMMWSYYRRFEKYSYTDSRCRTFPQFEASIIRLYHTIEKGLSYSNYRPGFGKENVEKLIATLQSYSDQGYDCTAFAYETALSCLQAYISKNLEYGVSDECLQARICALPGTANRLGGSIAVTAPVSPEIQNYKQLLRSRHSIRHFSNIPVETSLILQAVELAQYTPSACNRQPWKTRIVTEKSKMRLILENQNGNSGFGHEFDKLLIITADLSTQQKARELFQAYIDGGMYAENILNSLYFHGIGAVPLSASLTPAQEVYVRKVAGINDSEIIIIFVGVGNYPEGETLTTRSERKPPDTILL